MIPAGYMYKQVVARPDWLDDPRVQDIHSVSGCMSEEFCDYIPHWRHNGFWLFDRPAGMRTLAAEEHIDLADATLFYYEVHEQEYDKDLRSWRPSPAPYEPVEIEQPVGAVLKGFDVVTFSQDNKPECSPLSCNGLSAKVAVNAHCLFSTLAEAEAALSAGVFDKSEPGPFRIFAVYTCA